MGLRRFTAVMNSARSVAGRTLPDPGAVGRCLVGVVLAALLAGLWGPPGAATPAALAAAVTGSVALRSGPGAGVARLSAVVLLGAAGALVGAVTSAVSVAFVVAVLVCAFLAGLLWSIGAQTGIAGASLLMLVASAAPVPPTLWGLCGTFLAALVGGGLAMGLVGLWPQQRRRSRRAALSAAYSSLGADAHRLATDPEGQVEAAPLLALRAASTIAAQRRPFARRSRFRLPERIAVSLTMLAGRPVLGPTGDVLAAVAAPGRGAGANATEALRRYAQAAEAERGDVVVRRLSGQLREAAALRFGALVPAADRALPWRPPGGWSPMVATIGDQVTWESPVLRHALRLAVAAGAGVFIARLADVPAGVWIALTAIVVIRPETAHTYTRCAARIAGCVVGGAVVAAVSVPSSPSGIGAAVLAAACLAIAYLSAGAGHLAASAAVTAALAFLLDVGSGHEGNGVDRIVAMLIGGSLAVLAHACLPDHSLVRLHQRAGELLKTEIDYAATVIQAFVRTLDRPAETLAAAWDRTLRARAAFEAAAGAAVSDPADLRRWLTSYRTALNAVTTSCAALEDALPERPAADLDKGFVVAVDEYVDALCGDPVTPGATWRIDGDRLIAAERLVRDAAGALGHDDAAGRILVTEIAAITGCLDEITEG